MAGTDLRLPWTGEFSAGKLGDSALGDALAIVEKHEGNSEAIVEALRNRWLTGACQKWAVPSERRVCQNNLANNIVIGMASYGLVSLQHRHLTDFGRDLLALDPSERFDRFAEHILRNHCGIELLDAVRTLRKRGEAPALKTVRSQLRAAGLDVAHNNSDASKVRQWLEPAGVIDKKWNIDEVKVAELLGTSLDALDEWHALTRSQQAVITTLQRLARVRGLVPVSATQLQKFVRSEHGELLDEGSLKAKVWAPLDASGWIIHDVKTAGRGGKGGTITPTRKTCDIELDLAVAMNPSNLPPDLRASLGTSLTKIHVDLASSDRHVKGIALELLALNIASDLGLTPLQLRVRGTKTGGAEVDLVAEGAHLLFSRWVFQCKNTKSVSVGVLSKELGIATLLQAQVIVIVTTGKFTTTVRKYASRVTETTQFQVVLVDGQTLSSYAAGGGVSELRDHFFSHAASALTAKRQQVLEVLDDLVEDIE